MRSQFHHVIDVAPTVLGGRACQGSKVVNGVKQKPIEGVSMLYSFDNQCQVSPYDSILRDARQPGHLQGWLDGGGAAWPAAMANSGGGTGTFDNDPWELYNIEGLLPGR